MLSFLLFSCNEKERDSKSHGFTKLPVEKSGVYFSNTITESDSLNYFSFPYLYLGGGVSIGDINNDGLNDIYLTGNLVPNKLYLNKGNLEFEDISEKAEVSGDQRWYTGSTMVDVNNDGYLDIYVSASNYTHNSGNQLFINNGDNTFNEEAEAYGIADKSTSIQSTFFDYDNDGLLDLFVANYPIVKVSMGNHYYHDKMVANNFEESGHLYKNNGDKTFTDVTKKAGVQNFGMTLGLIATDFNNDGFKDLYLSNDFNVPEYFYRNNGDGTFSEVSNQVMQHTSMFGMGIDAGDFNNDGLTDILQVDMTAEDYKRSKTNMASMSPDTFYEAVDLGFDYQYMQNSLQLNNGFDSNNNPVFSEISRFAGLATTDWSWGALFADFDNDGHKDVFITNGIKRDVNNNDVNTEYETETFFGQKNNRDYTLIPSTPISNYALQNNGDFSYSNVTEEWGLQEKGFSNGFAYADLDNDGDLDLVINNIDQPASLLINEAQTSNNKFLRIKLNGKKQNQFGLGAKVSIKNSGNEQTQELTLTRGYQSSVAPILHFGLGNAKLVEELEIIWPNGNRQILKNIATNQLLTVKYEEENMLPKSHELFKSNFTDFTTVAKIEFIHQEDAYDDFINEPLLPHKNSRLGEALTVGDVNGDGLEDFFVGNAAGNPSAMYVQNQNQEFVKMKGPWEDDFHHEDTGALFFDADNDGDLDLYVVSGGNHIDKTDDYYQDRLYLNTNNGFKKADNALPKIPTSGLEVAAGDFDNDGDLDLFVGGRLLPGKYPLPAKSYILRNDGGNGEEIKFTDLTNELAQELEEAGLVTSALWDDFDDDGKLDLIITGEWMPIRFFKNTGTAFEEVTEKLGFGNYTGWWYDLQKLDVDADGDMDYLAGNLGLNYKYKASTKAPFEIYSNDFDENGTTDIVLSYEKYGTKLPLRGRECSSQQVPAIKQRFETYESFANADLNEIYGKKMLGDALHYKATTFAHHWIENKGDGSFEMHLLPNRTQFSAIKKFEIFYYNGDEYPDLIVGGNHYQSEVETPRNDAGFGLILTGNGTGYDVVPPNSSGLLIKGDLRNIKTMRLGKDKDTAFLFAKNNDSLRLLKFSRIHKNKMPTHAESAN